MPVRKFRSVEETKRDRGYAPDDPVLPRVIEGLWSFGDRVAGLRFPPGVYRHRSIEELNALTDLWAEESFRAFQASRPGGGDGRELHPHRRHDS